jgi:hypothetical protein
MFATNPILRQSYVPRPSHAPWFIAELISGEEHKPWSSSLRSLLHSPLTTSKSAQWNSYFTSGRNCTSTYVLPTFSVRCVRNPVLETRTSCCWVCVGFVKIGTGKAVLLLRAWIKLHLHVHRKNVPLWSQVRPGKVCAPRQSCAGVGSLGNAAHFPAYWSGKEGRKRHDDTCSSATFFTINPPRMTLEVNPVLSSETSTVVRHLLVFGRRRTQKARAQACSARGVARAKGRVFAVFRPPVQGTRSWTAIWKSASQTLTTDL